MYCCSISVTNFDDIYFAVCLLFSLFICTLSFIYRVWQILDLQVGRNWLAIPMIGVGYLSNPVSALFLITRMESWSLRQDVSKVPIDLVTLNASRECPLGLSNATLSRYLSFMHDASNSSPKVGPQSSIYQAGWINFWNIRIGSTAHPPNSPQIPTTFTFSLHYTHFPLHLHHVWCVVLCFQVPSPFPWHNVAKNAKNTNTTHPCFPSIPVLFPSRTENRDVSCKRSLDSTLADKPRLLGRSNTIPSFTARFKVHTGRPLRPSLGLG